MPDLLTVIKDLDHAFDLQENMNLFALLYADSKLFSGAACSLLTSQTSALTLGNLRVSVLNKIFRMYCLTAAPFNPSYTPGPTFTSPRSAPLAESTVK